MKPNIIWGSLFLERFAEGICHSFRRTASPEPWQAAVVRASSCEEKKIILPFLKIIKKECFHIKGKQNISERMRKFKAFFVYRHACTADVDLLVCLSGHRHGGVCSMGYVCLYYMFL